MFAVLCAIRNERRMEESESRPDLFPQELEPGYRNPTRFTLTGGGKDHEV